jgi:large subunit ribosomal protein L29
LDIKTKVMAKTKFVFSELTTEELKDKLVEDKIRYRKLKFNHAISPLDNPLDIRVLRRDIARGYTELKKRENAGN